MTQVRYHPLGPMLSGEGSRAFLGLALEAGAAPRPVVLVWAPPEVTRDAELTAQLQRETERASVLVHPNILRVHELVSLDTGLARVTEFADGESLRRVLEVRPRLPPAFAAQIVSDVAMGLHYAHIAGNDDGSPLVHGDLRPETVMVSFSGVCKVAGYGALSVAPRERNGRRVRNRRHYSAPEQLMGGREAITPRTDVFLLGLLLYECLSGRMPFHDAPDADQAALTRALPNLPSDVPRSLTEVIRLATAKRSKERYPNALEFREALVAAVEGKLPSATVFSEFLSQLFPPDRDARATRHQMLEIGLADVLRRPSLTTLPAVPTSAGDPVAPPQRPSGSTFRATPEPTVPDAPPEFKDVPFDEDDANAFDSVLEITGRHARPGVARPLDRDEPSLPPTFVEPVLTPPEAPGEELPGAEILEEEDKQSAPHKPPARPSRTVRLVGSLTAAAAAVGGLLLWNTLHTRESLPPPAPPEVIAVKPSAPASPPTPALPPPTPAASAGAAAVASGDDAGLSPSTATTLATASAPDSGVPPTPGSTPDSPGGLALASGSTPAAPSAQPPPPSPSPRPRPW